MSTRLDGCRASPLGGYLQALGLWRALDRTGLRDTAAHWHQDRLMLDGAGDVEQIVSHLVEHFTPLPIVSPWNAGSGFAGNGKSASAERTLALIRESSEPSLALLRDAVAAADQVVAVGRERGWGGSGTDLWDKKRKPEVVRLCRNLLPDDAVPWIDAAVVLGEDITFSRLLGTGGNFGRQELSVTYLDQALKAMAGGQRVREALRAALTGDESVPYDRGPVGQFDPGRAGGIQSSPAEKGDDKGFVNAWATLLTIEGALFFTSTVGRRQGSETARVAVPFQVRGSTSGFAGAATDEDISAEIWTPTWSRQASIREIRQLMRDGRAEWGGRAARSGLDFALAVRSLGTDRGIERFNRHVIVNRLGQNPLAISVDSIDVPQDDRTLGLRPIDVWLGTVRRVSHLPRSAQTALEATESALIETSRNDGASARLELLRQLGRLHRLVERSAEVRSKVRPLVLRDPNPWVNLSAGPEVRMAVALASASDGPSARPIGIVRNGLGHVRQERGILAWTGRPSPVDTEGPLDRLLADIHVRRAAALAGEPDPLGDQASIRGICTGPRTGWWAQPSDLSDLCSGNVDLDTTRSLLDGYLLFDWTTATPQHFEHRGSATPPPALTALLPFASPDGLRIVIPKETGGIGEAVLRGSPNWPALLRADRVDEVLNDAVLRLRAAGVQDLPPSSSFKAGAISGPALSACLLANVKRGDRVAAVSRIAQVRPLDHKSNQ